MLPPFPLLATFAVSEEARSFPAAVAGRDDVTVLLTGIGQENAERAIRRAMVDGRPALVLSCGFAGGLNPEMATGTVCFSADEGSDLEAALRTVGARPATFHCTNSVAVTALDKRALRERTGADAVEMESGVIRAVCRENNIPSATVRVISDAANEDLPMDFNRLLDARQNLSYARLALALLRSPRIVPDLIALQRRTRSAAEHLARALGALISRLPRP